MSLKFLKLIYVIGTERWMQCRLKHRHLLAAIWCNWHEIITYLQSTLHKPQHSLCLTLHKIHLDSLISEADRMVLTRVVRTPNPSTMLFSTVTVFWWDSLPQSYNAPSVTFKQPLITCNTKDTLLHWYNHRHPSHKRTTSVVGSAAYLQETIWGLRREATCYLFHDPKHRGQKCFVYGFKGFPACPADSIKVKERSVHEMYREEKTKLCERKLFCPLKISHQYIHRFM
jgi:hypothetical protein